MSFFGVGNLGNLGNPFASVVGQKIEQATDGALESEDWALNMEICDLINSSNEVARDAVKAIRKRLNQMAGKNYTIIMYTLTVLETCVKNCGKQFHVLVCNKDFINDLVKLIGPKNDPPTSVQDKVLNLIQCWAEAFISQPDLGGVVNVYQELKSKGVEFPPVDPDAKVPIYTPQRSVVDGPVEALSCSPPRSVSALPSPARHVQQNNVALSERQVSKLRSDLTVVESNMSVMSDMLNEMTAQSPEQHHASDLELLGELAVTLKAMQTRVAELVARVAGDENLTPDLLHVNDQLNSLLLRHQRFIRNRNVSGTGAPPSAILGAALGVPGVDTAAKEESSLIDLSDDVPNISKLSIQDKPKDEFDMLAQSRNVVDKQSSGDSSSVAPVVNDEMNQREFDEIAAWLSQERATTSAETTQQPPPESVTSSDFDKFLAERAAAADQLPGDNANRNRQIKKDEGSMFNL